MFLKDKKNSIIEKGEIIISLFQLFKANGILLPSFMKKKISNVINFYEPLIDLYLTKDEDINEYKDLIEKLIKLIRSNITLTKGPLEYIYQKLTLYYDSKEGEEKERLNENQMLKYLNLLKIFYTEGLKENNIFAKSSFTLDTNNQNFKEIKNYIYFNGIRSGISLGLNKNSINPNVDYPTLEHGLSFIFWIYIDSNLIKKYLEINNKIEINLVVINIAGEQIKLVLKDLYLLQVAINDSNIKNVKTNLIKINDWNNICFSIEKNASKFKIFINSEANSVTLPINKTFPVSSKINSIKLFENFIGKVSSFMIMTKVLDTKEVNYYSNNIKYGLYKNKIVFSFILSNEKNYFSNCKNYKYYEKCKSSKAISFYDLHSKKPNMKKKVSLFCPFAYNKEQNQLDDIFGNFIAVLGENDGVNVFVNNAKTISQLGGINNLLPIIELMYSTISKSKKTKYNLIDKSILTQSTFYEYIKLVKNILIGNSQNLINANKSKFCSSLSIFIEKFPSHLFTPKILQILLDIGKETFGNVDKLTRGENYINLILLNEKIISKYNTENQLVLWKNIYSFFTSDDTQIKDCLSIKRICLLLRLFDEERYNKYCCKKHASVFKDNNDSKTHDNADMEIMEPGMDVRLNEIFKIIQIYVDKLCEEEHTTYLFQLLCLDLSPCLQKKIIKLYINYFGNKKIELSKKTKALDILIKNNFIELIEYIFSVSLLDIRVDILSLFKIIFDNKELKTKFQNYMGIQNNGMNNFYIFMSENLLPEQLYVEIDDNNEKKEKSESKENTINNNNEDKLKNLLIDTLGPNKKKELLPLTKYFNKTIYENEINNVYNILLEWMLYKIPSPSYISSKKKDKEFKNIHNFIIDFSISFVSKSPFNFIDLFILTIISCFKDESIINREIFYTNKNLYPWLIETIFYFHNSEIDDYIYKKEDILSIKKNSLILFEEFYVHRRNHEEVNKRIYYIIKYSIHLKKINGNTNNKKILEITRITRLLLQKIMDISSIHMNYKAKACFDFILFHKNYTSLTGFRKHITNRNLNRYRREDLRKSHVVGRGKWDDDSNNTNTSNRITINNNINNLHLDIIEEDIKEKSNDDFDNRRNSIQILDLEEAPETTLKDKNGSNYIKNKTNVIPSYIFKSLHCNDIKNDNLENIEKEKKGNNLKTTWEDFSLYDSVIDYFSSNIWGTEHLRKKVKIDVDNNIMTLYKNLLKEYGEAKSYRNLLLKDVLKCLNIKYSEDDKEIKKEKELINVLNINVILLCISIEITQDIDEIVFLEGKFHQFIIFCILASININSNAPYYDFIQDNLYDALGFAFIFLKKRDAVKYNQFIDNLIIPIIDTDEVKKFRIFKNKKYNNKNSAICKLFELREKNKEEPEEMDDIIQNKISRNTYNISNKMNENDIFTKDSNIFKDDSNITTKKSKGNNIKVVFKGDNELIIKHLFEDTLNKMKEEQKYHFGFKTNYKNIYNTNIFYSGKSPTDEKLRINKIIKKVLPLYETLFKNYANDEYLREKRNRNNYKSNKSRLFSWSGFWSNKYLFYEHPELLKLKIRNHYTKEMVKPLLVPILDIDYYTPPFKKFDKTKLFNDNNYNYKINLDIDDILYDEVEDENNKNENKKNENNINGNIIIEEKKDNTEFITKKNKYGFNFLESIYKLSYNDIWEKYINYSKQKIVFEKLVALNKEPYSTLINSKKMSKNIENIQRENIYNCCIVKLTHHIKGYISTEKTRIRFIYESDVKEEELEIDSNYDKQMKCCFGSIFKNKKNDKDKVVISIEYTNIRYIFIRQYFYTESALEIYTDFNKSYFFNFKTSKDLIQFKSDILHHIVYREIKTEDFKGKKILGYQQLINPNSKKKSYYVNNKWEDWQNNNISTLEYLMWLNIYSGRSFNDLTQYPVFPWIITNYLDESKEITKSDFRNLNIPIGMLDLNEKGELRKETFIETYQTLKNDLKEMIPDFNYQDYLKKGEEYLESYRNKKLKKDKDKDNQEEITNLEYNQIPYFYGSHYSNPTYVSHFLTRIFPYTYNSIEIQGERFDDPDRMFTSMMKTFESTSSLKDDVRELIPEFYILPELFFNRNNLNLAQNYKDDQNNLIIINDVKLPLWCDNNPINFVIKLRRYLETNYIASNLNKWIDLIFGVNQRGEKAEENHNIFQAHTYEKNVKIDSIKDSDSRNALMRQYEMGVTPFQIFETESKNKINQNNTIDESKNIIIKTMNSKLFDYLKNKHFEKEKSKNNNENLNKKNVSLLKIVKIAIIENEKLRIFTNRNQWYTIKIEEGEIKNNSKSLKIEETKGGKYKNNSIKYACSYMISDIETPIVIYNDYQNILKGGFWDGRLELNIINTENKEEQSYQNQTIYNPDYSPITIMKISRNEKYLLCGTKDGIVISYILNEKKIEPKKSLYLFDDEVTSIAINENLNMFAASSRDGFINLHIFPSHKLVRTICLNNNKSENEKNEIIYAENIFLSSSPLPCLVIYISSKKLFKSFTINGEFICEINETDDSSTIKSPIVYTNSNFQDILLYGTNYGLIKIRKFPEMTLINSIAVFPEKEINTISLSPDKKICYVWSSDNTIALLKDEFDNDNNNINNNCEEVDFI